MLLEKVQHSLPSPWSETPGTGQGSCIPGSVCLHFHTEGHGWWLILLALAPLGVAPGTFCLMMPVYLVEE